MMTKLAKTWMHHVQQKSKQSDANFGKRNCRQGNYPCLFEQDECTVRFKSKQGMLIHTNEHLCIQLCKSSKYFEIQEIRSVFDKVSRKLFLVKWAGYDETENPWKSEGSLLRDGCKENIDTFWLESGISPAQEFYPNPDAKPRCWMCGYVCNNTIMRFLKTHITRTGHNWCKSRAHITAKKDV